jgi:hypothetical protein
MVNFVMRGDVGDFVPQSKNFPQKEKKRKKRKKVFF